MIVDFLSSTAAIASSAVPSSMANVCSQLAGPASVLVSAAPIQTMQDINDRKSVGTLPMLPYSCMAANCVLWTTYGFLQHTPAIWEPNAIGFGLSLHYLQSYIQHSPQTSETLPGSVNHHLGGVLAVSTAAAFAVLLSSTSSTAEVMMSSSQIQMLPTEAVGTAAMLFCVALFASPLAALKTVIKEKSAEAIPLPFAIASLLACFFWVVTGITQLNGDWNVIVPNSLGFMFGLAQVTLKFIYGNGGQQQQHEEHYELDQALQQQPEPAFVTTISKGYDKRRRPSPPSRVYSSVTPYI